MQVAIHSKEPKCVRYLWQNPALGYVFLQNLPYLCSLLGLINVSYRLEFLYQIARKQPNSLRIKMSNIKGIVNSK